MKKIIIGVLTIVCIVLIVTVAAIIKFHVRMAPGKSIIKKYSYSGSLNDLIYHIKAFAAKDTVVVFDITDTTGTAQTGYRLYMNIELKSDHENKLYSIACEPATNNAASGTGTEIDLIFAFDKISRIGGYNKKAEGVNSLVKYFDANFISPFQTSENIALNVLQL